MSSIKEKLMLIKNKGKLNKGNRYEFLFDLNPNEVLSDCMVESIDKELIYENKKIKSVLMLLRYPSNDVIPFDEYDCVFGVNFDNEIIDSSLLVSKKFEDVQKKFDDYKELLSSNNLELVIDSIIKDI